MKREERKVAVELLEVERMNTYKILAEFLAKKFYEKGFDKEEKMWFNEEAAKNSGNCNVQTLHRKKKGLLKKREVLFDYSVNLLKNILPTVPASGNSSPYW